MSEEEIKALLNNVGTSKAILKNEPGSLLGALLVDLMQDVTERLQKALVDRQVNTSRRNLSQSIKPGEVVYTGKEVAVGVSMDFYWKYVNYGVNGTEVNNGAPNWGPAPAQEKSFFESIRDWIPTRGVSLPPEFTSYESFTFAIMNSVKKEGQKKRPFFEDVVNNNLIQELKGPIERVMGRAIEVSIVAPWQ